MNNKGADQDAQASLCLYCLQNPEDRFFARVKAHIESQSQNPDFSNTCSSEHD